MLEGHWPLVGGPIAPAFLRRAWGGERVPIAVSSQFGLDEIVRIRDLDASFWDRIKQDNEVGFARLTNWLVSEVTRRIYHRRESIDGRLFEDFIAGLAVWPPLVLSRRTRNGLVNKGAYGDSKWLQSVTAEQFLSIRGLGARSLMELGCAVEHAMTEPVEISPEISTMAPADSATPEPSVNPALREALGSLELDFPLDRIRVGDPRFKEIENLIGQGNQSLREVLGTLIEAAEADREPTGSALMEAADTISEVRAELERIRNAKLDSELVHLLSLTTMHVRALAARLGWDGGGGCTLEEAGSLVGVTRERIRQLQARLSKNLGMVSYLPALENAISLLDSRAEHYEPDAAQALQLHGITRARFKPAGVLTAAQVFNWNIAFEVGRDGMSVGPLGDKGNLLPAALRSLSNLNYVASVQELLGRLAELDRHTSEADLRSWLSRTLDIVWLGETRDWFWWRRPDGRNRYVNVIREVLSIAPTVTLDSMRDALIRHSRYRGLSVSLPRHVLRAFCLAAGFTVVNDRVGHGSSELSEVAAYRPSRTDQKLVDLIREMGGVAYGREIRKRAVDSGLNRNTVQLYLSYSPVIERLDNGLYQVRGSETDPARIAALLTRPRIPRTSALADSGWTTDGAIWLAYRVSENIVDTAIISIPSGVRAVIGERRFAIYTPDGAPMGTLVVGDSGNAWGLGPFIRRRGVEAGDTLIVTLDANLESAVILVGGTELMSEYEEGEGIGPLQMLEKATRPMEEAI